MLLRESPIKSKSLNFVIDDKGNRVIYEGFYSDNKDLSDNQEQVLYGKIDDFAKAYSNMDNYTQLIEFCVYPLIRKQTPGYIRFRLSFQKAMTIPLAAICGAICCGILIFESKKSDIKADIEHEKRKAEWQKKQKPD